MPSLDATSFVITDTETTGPKEGRDRVIEIGAVKVQDGEILDRFQSLVNPERTVPKNIQRLTGINTPMVMEAPLMNEVMPAYLDFLGDGVLVAHNLSFDKRFLNAELAALDHDPLANRMLCSLKLARRLLPGLKSRGLSALSSFYNVNVNGRHRALGDAEATGIIFKRFLSQCAFEHQIDTLDELMAFQNRSYRSVRNPPRHLERLRQQVLPELPDAPGVYFFKAGNGSVLYIGKAKRLSNRVRSYFTSIEAHPNRKRKLIKKVRRITWRQTDTDLEALLLESRLIKEKKPTYNRAQRRYRRRPFLMLDPTAAYPQLGWSYRIEQDDARYYGPVRNADQAEAIIDMAARLYPLRECDDDTLRLGRRCLYADMDRCLAPCDTEVEDEYATAVEDTIAFLEGRSTALLDYLQERMESASERLDFERAALFRDGRKAVERFVRRQRLWQRPVRQRHGTIWYRDDVTQQVHGLWMRRGLLQHTTTQPQTDRVAPDAPLSDEAVQALATNHLHANGNDAPFSRQQVDAIRLGMHWLYRHRDAIHVVPWTGDADTFVEATHAAWEAL